MRPVNPQNPCRGILVARFTVVAHHQLVPANSREGSRRHLKARMHWFHRGLVLTGLDILEEETVRL